jgi:hypothetical protein
MWEEPCRGRSLDFPLVWVSEGTTDGRADQESLPLFLLICPCIRHCSKRGAQVCLGYLPFSVVMGCRPLLVHASGPPTRPFVDYGTERLDAIFRRNRAAFAPQSSS